MPHDAKGAELKVGDRVMVPGIVTNITPGCADYCNIQFETEVPMFPGPHKTQVSLNAKQVWKPETI